MAGILFIVNVPKKAYESDLKKNTIPNLILEKEKFERASKVILDLKEKVLESRCDSDVQDDDNGVISKCRSTDSLHHKKETDSFKCKSESSLTEKEEDEGKERRSYMKSSWEELKQAMKLKKNKLVITRPVRGVDILAAFHWDTPLETILADIVERLDIRNAAWSSTKDDKFWQVIFSLDSGRLSEELLQVLRTFGIGSRHLSSVSLLPCALYYKSSDGQSSSTSDLGIARSDSVPNTAWSRFSSSVRARTNLAQVLHEVRADAALTFDWVFLLLVAAFVAAIGLIENSTVILVASMLISPLMGPITAGTLGTAVQDRSLQYMGLKNEFLGLFLSLVMGFLFGLTICAIDERYEVMEDWPTYEMISRCEYRSLWVGILVAIPSGAGVALAVLGEYTASLVGVAISASLLPPAVNAGLLWAMALTRLLVTSSSQRWMVAQPAELAVLGTASLCLTLVNIVCIFLSGVAVYKVKEVCPLDRKDISWWRANRNRFAASKQKYQMDWDACAQWYDDKSENKENAEDNKSGSTTPGLVHSDTVTYRRQPSMIKRIRSKYVEGYSHSASTGDISIPIDFEIDSSEKNDSKNNSKTNSIQTINFENNDNQPETISQIQSVENKTHAYCNVAFENDGDRDSKQPTLEPSLSYTVDPKKFGFSLKHKSFDV